MFSQKQIKFLGHIFTAEGYKADPSLTKPIIKFLGDPPKNIVGIRKPLGLLKCFRGHI